jgi:hypothetical protein
MPGKDVPPTHPPSPQHPFSPSPSADPYWLLYTPSSSEGTSSAPTGLSSTSVAIYAEVVCSKGKEHVVDVTPCDRITSEIRGPSFRIRIG